LGGGGGGKAVLKAVLGDSVSAILQRSVEI